MPLDRLSRLTIYHRRRERDACDPGILRGLKLRAESRQFGGQDPEYVQTASCRSETDSRRRGLFRTEREWQADLLEAEDRRVSGRATNARRVVRPRESDGAVARWWDNTNARRSAGDRRAASGDRPDHSGSPGGRSRLLLV